MAAATASVNGYLTSTDWTTFNNKGSGTVTSVGGTGTVNGITLTGTVTSSGNLTLGGTLSGVSLTTQVSGVLPIANGGTNASTSSITSFNNITGYTASGATGTTSTNLVFSTSPTLVTPTLGAALATSIKFGSGTVLNKYEEGTWTPVITAAVGSFTSYTSVGVYTKIGRIVTAYCSFQITAVGTGSTFCTVAGYPFTSYNSAAPSDQASIALYRENGVTGATGFTGIAKNGTSGVLFGTFGNSYLFEFTMVYQAA
jgi:hypothetical protein